LKIVFFSFYYPPDLSAGSFRSVALARALANKISNNDELHIITTHPNRYSSFKILAQDKEQHKNIIIHRIRVPGHHSGMISQTFTFYKYAVSAYKLCKKIKPSFIIGTTGRLMTGLLTGFSSYKVGCNYFIDVRDIFSETISDLFSQKNKILGSIFKFIFSFFEKKLFNNSSGVNIVSEGFPEYYERNGIDTSMWSFFPNGVDKEFINLSLQKDFETQKVKRIIYAGNIGSGQGLDIVLPEIALNLGSNYHFLLIGDGGKKDILEQKINNNNIDNIEIIAPVDRETLIDYYLNADILFLHLNDIPAFQRVLPSKIFEYAAMGKPIVAGLNGYSAKFMNDHVPYANTFSSGDIEAAKSSILQASTVKVSDAIVSDFVAQYSRESIMEKMSEHILNVILSINSSN
jgi:glycosyltransferase involved in cell wall biosynthesis